MLGACNELYGLDETQVRPPVAAPPDTDNDGVADRDDVCPTVADPEQLDSDRDGFGDACDFCPDDVTPINHDEDGDLHGDACDVCPTEPDFQVDSDHDGVGDSCDDDFANQNRILLFDPFVDIGPVWERTGTWSTLGDAITSSPDARLLAPSVVLDGTKPFGLVAGITTIKPLGDGDVFGIELVDDGVVVASCLSRCSSNSCMLELTPSTEAGTHYMPMPLATMAIRLNPFDLYCVLGTNVAVDDFNVMTPSFARGAVRLVGSPKIQFRHLSVRQ
jgi:hypothetical protein